MDAAKKHGVEHLCEAPFVTKLFFAHVFKNYNLFTLKDDPIIGYLFTEEKYEQSSILYSNSIHGYRISISHGPNRIPICYETALFDPDDKMIFNGLAGYTGGDGVDNVKSFYKFSDLKAEIIKVVKTINELNDKV